MRKKILFFGSPSCGPCRQAKSLMTEEFLNENNIDLTYFDATKDFEQFVKYEIQSVPTFVVLEDNVVSNKKIGFKSLNEIKEL